MGNNIQEVVEQAEKAVLEVQPLAQMLTAVMVDFVNKHGFSGLVWLWAFWTRDSYSNEQHRI